MASACVPECGTRFYYLPLPAPIHQPANRRKIIKVNSGPNLTTERLILRGWRDSDREPFARMNADPKVMEFFPQTLSRQQSDLLVQRIEAHFERYGFGLWAVECCQSNTFIGFVGLNVPTFEAAFTPCVEIGWRLASQYWGQGLATEAARAALAYGFQTAPLNEIVSFTTLANTRSRRVMEKLGLGHNPADDFDHPQYPPGHPMRRHVLFRLTRSRWNQ